MEKHQHNVAVLPGDLNGITVTNAIMNLNDSISPVLNKPIKHTEKPYNADYFVEKGIKELGEEELGDLEKFDHIFLGAIGDPTKVKPGVLEKGILLNLRQSFDQYVNLRPIVLPEGVPSILSIKGPEDINFEICRENSEGLYAGKGRIQNEGTDDEVGIQEMHCSYRGVRRLADFALERARKKGGEKAKEPNLHFVFKTNVLDYASSPWNRVIEEVRKENSGINVEYQHVDIFNMLMATNPEQYDVVVTENMFGDITSDLGAALQGGIGSAVSGNLNPSGRFPSMFEPIHGSAPDKWYEKKDGEYVPGSYNEEKVQQIKPEAAFLSYAMMLEQMGEEKASGLVKGAALENIRDPSYRERSLDDLVNRAKTHIERNR